MPNEVQFGTMDPQLLVNTGPLRETRFDPVLGSQAVFRRLLTATARPGTVVSLGDFPLSIRMRGLWPACGLLLTVLDMEVTLHVVGPHATEVAGYLCFNTGARFAPVDEADFVL